MGHERERSYKLLRETPSEGCESNESDGGAVGETRLFCACAAAHPTLRAFPVVTVAQWVEVFWVKILTGETVVAAGVGILPVYYPIQPLRTCDLCESRHPAHSNLNQLNNSILPLQLLALAWAKLKHHVLLWPSYFEDSSYSNFIHWRYHISMMLTYSSF